MVTKQIRKGRKTRHQQAKLSDTRDIHDEIGELLGPAKMAMNSNYVFKASLVANVLLKGNLI